jgi:hypothetical protein
MNQTVFRQSLQLRIQSPITPTLQPQRPPGPDDRRPHPLREDYLSTQFEDHRSTSDTKFLQGWILIIIISP